MFPLDQNGFHSPIVSSARKGCVDVDSFKLSMMPDLSSRSSLEVEPQLVFNQIKNVFESLSASISGTNDDRCDDKNYSFKCNSNFNPNLHNISFDESTVDRPSSDEEAKYAIMNDIVSDYEYTDIELVQEALSVLIDDDEEEEFFSGDQCDRHDKSTASKNHLKREDSDFTLFPVRSTQQNPHDNRNLNSPMTADQVNYTISDAESKNLMDPHPPVLPQVSFDEEEEFNRKTFFDQKEVLHQQSENESGVQIVSSQSDDGPSNWLLQQLTLDALSFQKSSNYMSMSSSPMSRKARRINKGGIRASQETKHKHWSEEEDETLNMAVEMEQTKPIDWIKIAREYFNNLRSATQCKNRWKNYLKPGVIRGNWQKCEDEYIVLKVSRGFKWVDISKGLPGRTGEHVRERYVNVLDTKLKKTCWTTEEDKILFQHQRIVGNKWSEIRKLLPGRSDNSIKNRYHNRRNAHLRRIKRESLEK